MLMSLKELPMSLTDTNIVEFSSYGTKEYLESTVMCSSLFVEVEGLTCHSGPSEAPGRGRLTALLMSNRHFQVVQTQGIASFN